MKGVEAAPKFSKFAHEELVLDVFEGFIDQIPTDTWEPFDVIAAFDIFEHLHNPVRDLTILRGLAKLGSYLLITTPNIGSRLARIYGVDWRQVVPSHINYSTPRSMKLALARGGWELERMSEPRYSGPGPNSRAT